MSKIQMTQHLLRSSQKREKKLREASGKMEKLIVELLVKGDYDCPCEWPARMECASDEFCRKIRKLMEEEIRSNRAQRQAERNEEIMLENDELAKKLAESKKLTLSVAENQVPQENAARKRFGSEMSPNSPDNSPNSPQYSPTSPKRMMID